MDILANRIFFGFLSSLLVLSFFLLLPFKSHGQDKRDFGVQAGSTYYSGDFNEAKPLYQPSFAMGVIFRYNFNTQYSIRASALYGAIKGESPSGFFLPLSASTTFSNTLLEAEVMGEFNFVSFSPLSTRKKKLSPYVNIGLGVGQLSGSVLFHIPFGVGLKFSPGKRHTLAMEWRFHKTFNDELDSYAAPDDGKTPFLHNNDWFSYIGLIYTYRLYNSGNVCPVYK